MRTWLTILGIGVGIGAILFLVSLGYGLQRVLLEKITTSKALLSLDVASGESELVVLDEERLEEIANIPGVSKISPTINIPGQLTLGELTGDVALMGIRPDYFELSVMEAAYGDLFVARNRVVLSKAALKLFNVNPLESLGKEVGLTLFFPLTNEEGTTEVRVISKKEKYYISGITPDENVAYAFFPLGAIKDFDIQKYSGAKVVVDSEDYLEPVRAEIVKKGFLVSALSDTVKQANKIFRAIQIALALFGVVALLVAAIGMFNTMTIALLERTHEIGIMKAIGATSRDTWKMFLVESLIIGVLGGVAGIAIGFIGIFIFSQGINLVARGLGGQTVRLFYTPTWFIVFIFVFSSLVGFLTGLYPARRAAKLNPLDALRYK